MAPVPVNLCTGAGPSVSDPLLLPGGSFVSALVTRATEDGRRTELRIWGVDDGSETALDSGLGLAPGRGLSGGMHAWRHDGREVVVCTVDGTVVRMSIDEPGRAMPHAFGLPHGPVWSGPCYSPDGKQVAVVGDMRTLVVYDIATAGWVVPHEADDGFLVDAAWHRDRVICHAWDRPEMAWTSSSILGMEEMPGTAVQQPRTSPGSGSLGWVSDENGVANVVIEADGIMGERTVIEDDCEHGGPTWGPGQRTWCFSPDATKVAYSRNESGFGSLWVYDRLSGERTQVARAVHGCLSWEGDRICAMRSGARTPDQVVVYDVSDLSSPSRVFARHFADASWTAEHDQHLVEPVTGTADGVPYRLYEPAVPAGRLIVWVHGGPTDQWQVTWRPRFSYWLSRGWSIAVPDHRGSTGHGRAFMLELEGAWGTADADDTAAVARAVQERTGIDHGRTVLMGGSAGGLTVLSAANRHGKIAACVVAAYPVVDLALLLESDDPFEGHYNSILVGDVSVSPNMDVRRLRDVPVLLFHGSNDMLVVPEHSFRLRDSVTAAGGTVHVEVMEGEGHGFRDPLNLRRELELTQSFLDERTGRTR